MIKVIWPPASFCDLFSSCTKHEQHVCYHRVQLQKALEWEMFNPFVESVKIRSCLWRPQKDQNVWLTWVPKFLNHICLIAFNKVFSPTSCCRLFKTSMFSKPAKLVLYMWWLPCQHEGEWGKYWLSYYFFWRV